MTWNEGSAKSHRVKPENAAGRNDLPRARILTLVLFVLIGLLAAADPAAATGDTFLTKERLHETIPGDPIPDDEPADPEDEDAGPEPEPEEPQDGTPSSSPYRGRPTPPTGNGSDDKEESDDADEEDGQQDPDGHRDLGHLLLSQVCLVSSRSCTMDPADEDGAGTAPRGGEPDPSEPGSSSPTELPPARDSAGPSAAESATESAPRAPTALQEIAKATVTKSSLLVLLAWTLFIASPGRSRTARIDLGQLRPMGPDEGPRALAPRREGPGAAAPGERRPTRGLSP